jgi:predicted nucleic acid-binding protein
VADMQVVDTSVLIDQRRGVQSAARYVSDLAARNIAAIHPVTAAEMITGTPDRSPLARVKAMLSPFRALAVRNTDFVLAIELLERHVLAVRIGWPDCLIAATCLRLDLPLVTLNDKHFKPIRGLSVVRPY